MGVFQFKRFDVDDTLCGMKVGTDGVLLGAWTRCSGYARIIDAGCGSGLIALMMAQRNEKALITAVDVSAEACADARSNADRSPWGGRISVVCRDLTTDPWPDLTPGPLLIISNPPFFSETLHSPEQDRALARHGEGFDVISLIRMSSRMLSGSDDALAFVAPWSRSDEIEFELSLCRMEMRRMCAVTTREGREPSRILVEAGMQPPVPSGMEREELTLRDASNILTPRYIRLTSEFYLDK